MGMVSGMETMDKTELQALSEAYVINTYGERKLCFERGSGTSLWDEEGNEYLDFFAGIAVVNLGHCHPKVTEAICEQAKKLVHVSNLYLIEPQMKLAELLSKNSFAEKWFFCNSGAEANEGAIKLVRRYWSQKGTPKPTIVCANDSFHGRTLAALKATGQPKYQAGFEPLIEGFVHVDFDNLEELEKALTPDVGAVFLEPIQGEGGVRMPSQDYLSSVRRLCDEKNVLLVLDEVQTGMGRTGKLFAHEHSGIAPDVVTIAKGLGNGVPIGALGCTDEVASGFSVGSHGSTFGGNPLCTAAGLATLSVLTEPGFLENVAETGRYFEHRLEGLTSRHESIVDIRVKGLMVGVEFSKVVTPLIVSLLESWIVCGPAGPNVLRFLPPLIATQAEVDRVVDALDEALGSF